MSINVTTITPIKIFVDEKGNLSRSLDRLEIQFESLKKQLYVNLDIIVSDMSTDPIAIKQLKAICSKHGVRYINTKTNLIFNKGLLLNVGIKNASNKSNFICFLDLDLFYRRDVIKRCYDRFAETKKRVIIGNTFYLDRKPELKEINFANFKKFNSCSKHKSCAPGYAEGGLQFYEKSFLYRLNGCDERFNIWGGPDNEILIRARRLGYETKAFYGSSKIFMLHIPHPIHHIPNLNKEISERTRTINRVFYKHLRKGRLADVSDSWGDEKNIFGPRLFGKDIYYGNEQEGYYDANIHDIENIVSSRWVKQ